MLSTHQVLSVCVCGCVRSLIDGGGLLLQAINAPQTRPRQHVPSSIIIFNRECVLVGGHTRPGDVVLHFSLDMVESCLKLYLYLFDHIHTSMQTQFGDAHVDMMLRFCARVIQTTEIMRVACTQLTDVT